MVRFLIIDVTTMFLNATFASLRRSPHGSKNNISWFSLVASLSAYHVRS
jgi:hypothetical protein